MKDFKKNLAAIFAMLDFTKKAKDGTLTKEEWTKIFDSYKQKYGTDLTADMQAAEKLKEAEEQQLQIIDILKEADTSVDNSNDNQEGIINDDKTKDDSSLDVVESIRNLMSENKILKEQNQAMKKTAAPDTSIETIQSTFNINGPGTTATYLFGIENSMFDMKHRWNLIANNPGYALINPVDEDEHGPVFRNVAVKFAKTLAKRYDYLKENKMLDPQKLASGFSLGTDRLGDAGLGDQYMIRRQDALIARLLELRTVTEFFPVRYGIQDRDMITNAYFTEVSQAYQPGEIWKGDMDLEPEFGYVDDAMAKVKFGQMKEIERMYIGYLNTDGSDPVKWSMIEFALLGIFKKMMTEQNKRRIMGIYVKPESGEAGSYLNAGTGVVYTLIRLFHENKMLLNDDLLYSDYDDTDMLDCVKEFVNDILINLTEDQELTGYYLYLNNNHQSWWIKNIREAYGKDIDFKGPDSYLNVVPDTNIRIKWLPNMGQFKLMFIQEPGNIQFLENVAGEMLALKIKEDMELVKGWSTWKEGTGAAYVGRSFKSKEELVENNFELQQIFMNKPCQEVDPDVTELKADKKKSFWFLTGENTKDTTITDIKNARKGTAYIIECGSETNASKITKTGKFENITAAWTPTAPGDYIMVVLDSKNSFLELERCVGGTRTVNELLQPNVPGAR